MTNCRSRTRRYKKDPKIHLQLDMGLKLKIVPDS
jgi:hypothetical protein